jgi:hypothetical protein
MAQSNRYAADFAYINVTANDMACICDDEKNTAATIRCNICNNHQHKACVPDVRFEKEDEFKMKVEFLARQAYVSKNYACINCKPQAHPHLMESIAMRCQDNKETIRDSLEPLMWPEYCRLSSQPPRSVEPPSFGISWKQGLDKLLGAVPAFEVHIILKKLTAGAGLKALKGYGGNVREKNYQRLGVLAEVMGWRQIGSFWSGGT